jgi:hypothetical protein
MTDLRDAARQALEALEGWKDDAPSQWSTNDEKLITVLRAALEQPEQEPVVLFTKYGPPTMRDRDFWSAGYAAATARAIEATLKERNA